MTKSNFCARVEDSVIKEFKAFVFNKYGKLHTGFGTEVQQALAHWLNEHGLNTHANSHINPGMPKSQGKLDSIIATLRSTGLSNQFTTKDWERACIHVVGCDERTVLKYLKLAKTLGRAKPYAGSVWEIV